jgi:RimJ/RimL family protein N-acetyltransferase
MMINGQKVHLKLFGPEHLHDPRYYAWLCDPDVVRYIGREDLLRGIPFSEAEKYAQQMWESAYCHFLAVHHAGTGQFIGTAKVNFMSAEGRRNGVADVGIMLGEREFRGKGLSVDVLRAASIHAFDVLEARKLTAGAYQVNRPVIKAFLRIGYKVDGQLRQHLAVEGGYCDHVLMSCFPQELIR